MVIRASRTSGSDFPSTSTRTVLLAGEASSWVTSTNNLPPAVYIGRPAVSWNTDNPNGFMGSAEVFFDRSAQALELQNLVIRQRLCVLPLGLDLLLLGAASFYGIQSQLLGGYLLIDNLAVPHLIAISIHQPGDQGLTKPKAGIDG